MLYKFLLVVPSVKLHTVHLGIAVASMSAAVMSFWEHKRVMISTSLITSTVFVLVLCQGGLQPNAPTAALRITEEQALSALRTTGERVQKLKLEDSQCKVQEYGNGWGGHNLCELSQPVSEKCMFWSFGISNDYSFDIDLSEAGCSGFAFDPSVSLPSQLVERVIFFQMAANMLTESEKLPAYTYASLPKLMQALHVTGIDVLKLDCEGCEYALFSDISQSGKNMFEHVQQLTIELHVSDAFLLTRDHVVELGKLLHLLRLSNMHLVSVDLTSLGPGESGCTNIAGTGYPCEIGLACHNLLFAKAPATQA